MFIPTVTRAVELSIHNIVIVVSAEIAQLGER